MTIHKSFRDYINLIESAQQGVAEAYTPSAGELARDLIKMPDSDFSKKYGMSKQQANHYYSSSKLKEQGVAEGFSDIVKGVKRKVAGKADPKEVEKDYAVKARREIGDANRYNNPAAYADSDKAVKRYNKVAKVVNKEGVAEEQLEETSPEAIAKINQITRK